MIIILHSIFLIIGELNIIAFLCQHHFRHDLLCILSQNMLETLMFPYETDNSIPLREQITFRRFKCLNVASLFSSSFS